MPKLKEVQEFISMHTFCYARKEGQGHVKKEECSCYQKGETSCEAYKEANRFHELYRNMEKEGLSREEILQTFETTLEGKEAQWYPYNVVKC